MAHSPVPFPRIGIAGAQADDGPTAEGGTHVDDLGKLEGGVPQRRSRADDPGTHTDDDRIGPEHRSGDGEPAGQRDGFLRAAERVTDGDRRAKESLLGEFIDDVAQRDRKRGAVSHDVDQPGVRAAGGERRGHDTDLAVERAADDRDTTEAGLDLAQVFLGGPGVRLQRCVSELHDVPVTGGHEFAVGEVPVHDMPTARAESELDRGRVADDGVSERHRAGHLGQVVRALRVGVVGEDHEHALQPGAFAEDLGDRSGAKRGHDYLDPAATR